MSWLKLIISYNIALWAIIQYKDVQADIWRYNNEIITTKRRRDVFWSNNDYVIAWFYGRVLSRS